MNHRITFLALVLCFAVTFAAPAFAGNETPAPTQPPASEPGQGDQGQGDQGQADQGNPKDGKGCCILDLIKKIFCHPKDEAALKDAMQKLLTLTASDLQLCLDTISGKDVPYCKVIPAVGNLNHALSALDKIDPPKTLKPILKELHKRISHAKFYLVVNDRDEAENRVRAALEYIGTLKS